MLDDTFEPSRLRRRAGRMLAGGFSRGLRQRLEGHAVRLACQLPGALDPELADICALAMTLIATPRLSQGVVGSRDVENVIDDLEQYSQLGRETMKGDEFPLVGDPRQQ
jgi:hypothetical protein